MKATGKQWNDFLASWPQGWWYDDYDIRINGVPIEDAAAPDVVKDSDRIELTYGVICSEGEDDRSLVRQFQKWIREQNVTTFLVEVPKTVDAHYFEKQMRGLFGAKVVK